jgi:hypothetical protein
MMKKAQGISINTIVIAAIAVLVLVVLAAILVVQSGKFSTTLQSCEDVGGRCKDIDRGNPTTLGCDRTIDGFQNPSLRWQCLRTENGDTYVDTDKVCCLPGTAE